MSQNQLPQPTLNALSVMSTWLNADPVEGAQKRPSLRFGVFGNVPRITVKTNVPNDTQNGKIDFKCDTATFAAAMAYVKNLANNVPDTPNERKFIYQDDYVAGKKLDKIIPLTTLVIGREQNTGRIYIALLSSQSNRPRIRFFFGPSRFHNITNGDGSQITPKEMSEAYAIGFIEPITAIIYQLLITQFDENAKNVSNPANFQNSGGGQRQNNNYRGNNNGGGNYQQRAPSNNTFDSDIPEF